MEARSRGRGWIWVVAIIVALFLLTLGTVAVVLLMGPETGSNTASRPSWEEEYISGSGADKIVVVPVTGVIGAEGDAFSASGTTPETLKSQLRQAAGDKRVKAVILEVNSPGGGVVASDEMHKAILDFKQENKKPVVVQMKEVAASGGYYISTAADKVVANPTTITGSLGVIFSYLNYAEAEKRLGLDQVVIKSGKFKDIASPSRELTPEEHKILQSLIDESYNQFVQVISQGRNMPPERVRKIADGRIYSGLQAKSLGLVDSLGGLETAVDISRQLANTEEATVVRYTRKPGFLELLRTRLGSSEPEVLKTLKAAGLNLTPELQYMYRPGS